MRSSTGTVADPLAATADVRVGWTQWTQRGLRQRPHDDCRHLWAGRWAGRQGDTLGQGGPTVISMLISLKIHTQRGTRLQCNCQCAYLNASWQSPVPRCAKIPYRAQWAGLISGPKQAGQL